MHLIVKWLYRLEDTILISLLVGMILLASSQILLRNLFEYGLVWADPLLRVMVLWVGLLGAMVASRDNRHIRIDLLTRFLSKRQHLFIQVLVGQFSAWICFIIGWFGAKWVYLDYQDGLPGFENVPAWALEFIVPLAFLVIGLRYFSLSVCWANMFIRRLEQGCGDSL